MTPIEEHPELPGYFRSSIGGWSFSEEENGDLEYVDEAIAAWQEWREFLVQKQARESQETLF
jgi:hypothetical protein